MTTEVELYNLNDPSALLHLSQRARALLSRSTLQAKSQVASLISQPEDPLEWNELEQTFHACLRVGDDKVAHECLERLSARFGSMNHRIAALRGLYQEAVASDEEDLRRVLQDYNKIVSDDPMNVAIHKRRTALIRCMGRPQDALEGLVRFLNTFPGDVEGWCELADLYKEQGLLPQAIFSLEEALLNVPNAWNIHARLGELNYMASQQPQESISSSQKYLAEAIRRFGRSVELCQDYLRGYYGLSLATQKYTDLIATASHKDREDAEFSVETIQRLGKQATMKMKQIVDFETSKTAIQRGDIIAAQALLESGKV